MAQIHVNSEIGKLKKIILHRPGRELERISPSNLEDVLFEDIPWMKRMKEEHNGFAKMLKKHGAQVLYLEDLFIEVLEEKQWAASLIDEVLKKEVLADGRILFKLREYLLSLKAEQLAETMIAGLGIDEAGFKGSELSEYIGAKYSYYFQPLPNLYFMRDPGAMVGDGMIEGVMKRPIRQREAIILRYVHRYSSALKGNKIFYDNTKHPMTIEGGDILVLSSKALIVGCSQRTSAFAIESLAKELFKESTFEQIIVVKLPLMRAFMHLDTVFTMLDYDKFTIYPGILNELDVASIHKGAGNSLRFSREESLKSAIENALGIQGILLICSGGSNPVTAEREQWNDSTNTFAISPGVVVTYNRNEVSNEILQKAGITVYTIEGSELVRGRGGPRCMSMPIWREDLD